MSAGCGHSNSRESTRNPPASRLARHDSAARNVTKEQNGWSQRCQEATRPQQQAAAAAAAAVVAAEQLQGRAALICSTQHISLLAEPLQPLRSTFPPHSPPTAVVVVVHHAIIVRLHSSIYLVDTRIAYLVHNRTLAHIPTLSENVKTVLSSIVKHERSVHVRTRVACIIIFWSSGQHWSGTPCCPHLLKYST